MQIALSRSQSVTDRESGHEFDFPSFEVIKLRPPTQNLPVILVYAYGTESNEGGLPPCLHKTNRVRSSRFGYWVFDQGRLLPQAIRRTFFVPEDVEGDPSERTA